MTNPTLIAVVLTIIAVIAVAAYFLLFSSGDEDVDEVVDEVVEQTKTPDTDDTDVSDGIYRFDTNLGTHITGAKSVIQTIPHDTQSLQDAKDVCMKDVKCNHLVSNNSRLVYYLIEGQGVSQPHHLFDSYSKVPTS